MWIDKHIIKFVLFFMIILVSFAGLYKVKTLNIIIKKLIVKQDSLKLNLDKFNQEGIKVKVTMYQPTFPQTDDTPDITADGTKFQIDKASNYRYVALSRNLLHRWGGPFNYGDFIQIKGTAHKDGVYQVKDTMNPKWVNVVDILESLHIKPYKYENVNLFKTTWTTN